MGLHMKRMVKIMLADEIRQHIIGIPYNEESRRRIREHADGVIYALAMLDEINDDTRIGVEDLLDRLTKGTAEGLRSLVGFGPYNY